MIRAIIIDDEINCIEVLLYEIGRLKVEIEIVSTFSQPQKALTFLEENTIDVIFLDIEMPRMNAFQFLDKIPDIQAHIIFTTAYDHYALKAFRYYAVDYLLKPISGEQLEEALEKTLEKTQTFEKSMINEIYSKIKSPNSVFNKIAVPVEHGFKMIKIDDIIYCEADSNYSKIHLLNEGPIVVSKTLKYFDNLLHSHGFFRVHQSKLINVNYIENYSRIDGGIVTLSNGANIMVSRANKKTFEAFLSSFAG
ncbi:MAG: two-component system LytT family response regulator [Saprospiraceae bacterium]|jgi:two-component system LytT family response regulator|tara:strand:- start:3506 stop:4258 length:753 start_codon:yes stop_codon:yes gene_type:complete